MRFILTFFISPRVSFHSVFISLTFAHLCNSLLFLPLFLSFLYNSSSLHIFIMLIFKVYFSHSPYSFSLVLTLHLLHFLFFHIQMLFVFIFIPHLLLMSRLSLFPSLSLLIFLSYSFFQSLRFLMDSYFFSFLSGCTPPTSLPLSLTLPRPSSLSSHPLSFHQLAAAE